MQVVEDSIRAGANPNVVDDGLVPARPGPARPGPPCSGLTSHLQS